jgi:hypothetical protein
MFVWVAQDIVFVKKHGHDILYGLLTFYLCDDTMPICGIYWKLNAGGDVD